MNEIELKKLLVKEVFNKGRSVPDFGWLSPENCLQLRNYIWRVCGYLNEEEKESG